MEGHPVSHWGMGTELRQSCLSSGARLPQAPTEERNERGRRRGGGRLPLGFFNCLAVIAYLSPPGRTRSKSTSPSLGGPERKRAERGKERGGAAGGGGEGAVRGLPGEAKAGLPRKNKGRSRGQVGAMTHEDRAADIQPSRKLSAPTTRYSLTL